MAVALVNLEQYDLARHHFEEAVRIRPGHAAIIANLKQCREDLARHRFLVGRELELTDPYRALSDYQAAAGAMPTWYKPIARQAFVLASTVVDSVRNGEKAVSLARRAIELRAVPTKVYGVITVWYGRESTVGRQGVYPLNT